MFNLKHDCMKHGHRFEERFDSQPSNKGIELERGTNEALRIVTEHNTIKTYVQDICVRCGDVVKRDQGPPIAEAQS